MNNFGRDTIREIVRVVNQDIVVENWEYPQVTSTKLLTCAYQNPKFQE